MPFTVRGIPQEVADEVRRADDELVAGQPAAAAARLYAIVEGPRYQDFSDTEDFPLLDFGIRVVSTEPTQAVFAIEGHERSLEFVYRLDRLRPFSIAPSGGGP